MLLAQHKETGRIYIVVGTGVERGTWWNNFKQHYIYLANKTGVIHCFNKSEVRILAVDDTPIEQVLTRLETAYYEK